jgi:hypothetical protein
MQHMDIWATNVMIAAHQENLTRALRDSQRRGVLSVQVGSMLIRLGEWLRRDAHDAASGRVPSSARRHPQAA